MERYTKVVMNKSRILSERIKIMSRMIFIRLQINKFLGFSIPEFMWGALFWM